MTAAPELTTVKNTRPPPDQVLVDIADYVFNYKIQNEQTFDTARLCMTDALACALDALDFEECTKMIGPVVPGTVVPNGARIPGTKWELDPDTATFTLGCMIRWLDYNDTFTAATSIHPSDNLAGILPLADYLSRVRVAADKEPLSMRDVLENLIKAYEISGNLAIENNLRSTGLSDHPLLYRVAGCAILTRMLGGTREHVINALSNAFMDVSLTVYRHAPNTGWRKSWAAADASLQAMRIARICAKGQTGYPTVLTKEIEGFYEARFGGKPFTFLQPYGEYVINNSNFKFVAAGAHGQTAAECAMRLHAHVKDRIENIDRIEVRVGRNTMHTMHKTGPMRNPADRVKCVEYVMAVGLIKGEINPVDCEDEFAADPRIDTLRDKMTLTQDDSYTAAYDDPDRRANPGSIQVWFKDGTSTPKVEIEYPAGNVRRRAEVAPILRKKFESALSRRFAQKQREQILKLCDDAATLYHTPVNRFMDLLVP